MGWLHCHFMTGMAALIGVISAFVALALLRLIGFFTHLFYYHAIDSRLVSPADNRLGVWALLVPIVGGLIVGLMARYGSERIRGHGIPEALEAILIGQSRMSARVAVLKPLSSAISIGTGGPFGAEGVAGALRVPLLGAGPLFPVPPHAALTADGLVIALALGIAAGFGSGLLTWLVYACEDLFRKVPIHWMWWPLLGGAVIGLGGLLYPRALGVGYDTIHDLLTGQLVGVALLGLVVTKAVIWAVALGSGTSGGVLAPLLIMGGALGALEAHWIPSGDPGLWAALSMGAMMGGTMRSPFTAVAFIVELTHDVNVLPGLLVACVAADAVTVLLMKRSILTEKVARRGYHVTREYIANPLHLLRVQDVMEPPVLQVGARPPAVSYPDELLDHALTKMLEHEVDLLPVVNRSEPEQVVGYVAHDGILPPWGQFARDEGRREPGWLAAQFRKVRDRPAS